MKRTIKEIFEEIHRRDIKDEERVVKYLKKKKLWGQACNIAIPEDREEPRAQA